ncbi:GntR family transcriptional regulator [Streptomyces sp. NPDC004539]|uniref:GntR family transcriptional regulator n=1 Tax=Streptomyces sp. NPDC004539 TaxID=3154280 RepID=UPI0033B682C3
MTDLLPDDFRGLNLDLAQAGQAGRVFRGLHDAITNGQLPPGTPLTYDDIQTGYKAPVPVVTAAFRGLARTHLTDTPTHTGTHVLRPLERPARGHRETQTQYVQRTVRHRIAVGFYPVGDLLPSYRDLGHTFGASANLVHHALTPLIHAGLLTPSRTPPGIRVAQHPTTGRRP